MGGAAVVGAQGGRGAVFWRPGQTCRWWVGRRWWVRRWWCVGGVVVVGAWGGGTTARRSAGGMRADVALAVTCLQRSAPPSRLQTFTRPNHIVMLHLNICALSVQSSSSVEKNVSRIQVGK